MTSNMDLWNSVSRPPTSALKKISGGRLSGMTDINPQWRYQVMTEQLGPIGVGWKYTIDRTWTDQGPDGEMMAFAQVSLFIKHAGSWSDAIQGIGGSSMIATEKGHLRGSDECYKMAVTDALSVCLKMLGVAADIYLRLFDGSKYVDDHADTPSQQMPSYDPKIAAKIYAAATTVALAELWKSMTVDQRRAHAPLKDKKKAELEAKAGTDEFVAEMDAEAGRMAQ